MNDILNKTWDDLDNIAQKYLDPKSNEPFEGNIYQGIKEGWGLERFYNLNNLSSNVNSVFEIGFNAGHSTAIFLASNPNSIVTALDIGKHSYVVKCYEYLEKLYPNRLNLVVLDSLHMSEFIYRFRNNKFDLIHIDGQHSEHYPYNDFIFSYFLSHSDTIWIADDYIETFDWGRNVIKAWEYMVTNGKLETIKDLTSVTIGQAIGKVIM